MAKDNAPDLISLFGLNAEEALGLGLTDAPSDDLQEPTHQQAGATGSAGRSLRCSPVPGSAGVSPVPVGPGSAGVSPVPVGRLLSAGTGEQRSERPALPDFSRAVASRDDDLAFLVMLEGNADSSLSSMGADSSLSSMGADSSLSRMGFEGRRDLMTPLGTAGILPASAGPAGSGVPLGSDPGGSARQDTPPEKTLTAVGDMQPPPSGVSESDEATIDLAALFGMSAEEALGLGLTATADAVNTDAADPDIDECTPVSSMDAPHTPWDHPRDAGIPSPTHTSMMADGVAATGTGETPAIPGGLAPPMRGEGEYPAISSPPTPLPTHDREDRGEDIPILAAEGGSVDADVIDPLLLDAFAEESAELLDALHVELENIESNAGDHGALLEIRRIVHTIKGGAKMCLFEHVVTLTHSCENLLDLSADGASPLDTPALRALFSCEPLLRALVQDALMDQRDAGHIDAAVELAAHFDALRTNASAERGDQRDEATANDHYDQCNTDELAGTARSVETDIAPIFPNMDASTSAGNAVDDATTDAHGTRQEAVIAGAREQPARTLDDAEAVALDPGPGMRTIPIGGASEGDTLERGGGRRARASINVDLSKVDAVVAKVTEMAAHRSSYQGMVGQLMETTGEARRGILRLQNLSLDIANECAATQPAPTTAPHAGANDLGLESYSALNTLALQLQEAVADQQALIEKMYDTITNHWSLRATEHRVDADLQSALMNIRLIPLSTMRVRLDGVIRQAAQATGKNVRWQLQGGAVAVEKSVFDRLFEPLMHLLRNAVDHGLEQPAARRAAGKPETGVIIVAVKGEDSHVVITVSDDGAGIDPHKIAAIAVARGVVGVERAASLSAWQKLELIFTPGFSTAASVSHLSGRGVGMDAVREACLRMGGAIDVESRPDGGQDQGTTFTMRLPLSLSVTRGLIVRDGSCYMAVPVGQITALHLVSASDIVDGPGGRVARIEGQDLPVYNLPPLPGAAAPAYVQHGEAHVLQLPHDGGSLGLIIEDVLDEEEMLIKPAPPLLRGVKTLLGAHVLPDGTVAPVINLPRLLADLRPAATLRADKEERGERGPVALVVDDSMSMRVALTGTLQGAGFTVLTARDGQEALDALKRDGLPALITLDIEMPRMDGLEALFAIRQLPGAGRLPIFIMTSRGGAKHRRAAEQLGATRYFTKPYRDSELAAAARAALL